MVYIGIDSGLEGAIAVIDRRGACVYDMPVLGNGRVDVIEIQSLLTYSGEEVICYLEQSQAMPGQGVVSMFKYGINYGRVLAVLDSSGISYQEISPLKWKREFNLVSNKKKGIVYEKSDAVDIAVKLFPSLREELRIPSKKSKKGYVIKDGRADSLLICEYCRRWSGR